MKLTQTNNNIDTHFFQNIWVGKKSKSNQSLNFYILCITSLHTLYNYSLVWILSQDEQERIEILKDAVDSEALLKVPAEKRTTTPYMTKYERARVLGTRALQIAYVHFIINNILLIIIIVLIVIYVSCKWSFVVLFYKQCLTTVGHSSRKYRGRPP